MLEAVGDRSGKSTTESISKIVAGSLRLMAEDKFKAQARAIIEGCPFHMEEAIADDLRLADAENQQLRRDLLWALEMLERHLTATELLDQVREKRRTLSKTGKS
jgi:hypothetical protein